MTSRTALPTNPFRSPDRALPAQTRLDEFEIERVLAQSSFAVVYRAYDHALKLHVAIKEYLPDALALRSAETQVVLRAHTHAERFGQGLTAFVAEAQTLARCEHPSLLRIGRILHRHGTAYRVMRYCPGPTLLEYRRQLGATPGAAVMRRWLDGLLGALDALHEEGCVHGAVAPGNILLLPGERPMLLDFDAVRGALISDRTQSMMAALEPCFEPPEQRLAPEQRVTGPWSDLYALAATLHFCIGGQLPAPPSGAGRGFEPLADVWQRLRAAQPGLGDAPGWLGALDACLRDDVQARPQSVAQLQALLDTRPDPAPAIAPRRPPAPRAAPRTFSELKILPAADSGAGAAPLGGAAGPSAEAAAAPAAYAPVAAPPLPVPPVAPPAAAAAVATPAHPSFTPPSLAAAGSAGEAPSAAPQRSALPKDVQGERVIAELDQTFAAIARQATADANTAAPPPPQAPPAERCEPETAPSDNLLLELLATRKGRRALGALVALLLAAMVGMTWWLLQEAQPGPVGSAVPGVAAERDAAVPPASPGATLAAAPPAAGIADKGGSAAAGRPPKPAKPLPSPRQRCEGRSRTALVQCLQEQCAKRAYARHEQCVRLRKEQKL